MTPRGGQHICVFAITPPLDWNTPRIILMVIQPELVEACLLPIISCYTKNHSGVGSFILIAGQVCLELHIFQSIQTCVSCVTCYATLPP